MSYRVVIPTAGIGSRLGSLTKYLNKSLVGIANRPTISHQIEQFPDDCEFVIALGHRGKLVKDFLELAYPERAFHFCNVSPYEGEGSGLGLSLLACEEHLQQPFVFISCDTLVIEEIKPPDHNWLGYAEVDDASHYRTLKLIRNDVKEICEKGVIEESHKAYIGLAGIYDYKTFWNEMRAGGRLAIEQGESFGLRKIVKEFDTKGLTFTWHDTGNPVELEKTRQIYREPNEPNILEKENEAIWFVGDAVIKYSDDQNFISNRVKRVENIKEFVPKVYANRANMYCYHKVKGQVLSQAITIPLFNKLLQQCQYFWNVHKLDETDKNEFQKSCLKFYKDKTFERVELFYNNFNKTDCIEVINGEIMPPLTELLSSVDWNWMSDGLAGRFHGDFHFENILWSEEDDKFTFLDWRQNFGGKLSRGDIYYDLAKLMHGLIVSHELIVDDHYSVEWDGVEISYVLHRKQALVECELSFNQWVQDNGYDLKKVRVLTALIYLNIAALHHYPYSLFLYGLGKRMLNNELNINDS
jgi:NDP-sugar pyrophosphorylase family protein